MPANAAPQMFTVRRNFPDRALRDVSAAVRAQMEDSGFASLRPANSRVAIGVGSRGIRNIDAIVKAVVDYWLAHGHRPFLFPAMGSHGAATAAGQIDVLAHYGITESAMGCEIESNLDVVSLGRTAEGFEAFAGVDAWGADAVMVINRVKWHTSFVGANESGLAKMLAIGLGKHAGAGSSHQSARRHGMEKVIQGVAAHVLALGKVLGGLAILEDAHHNTAHVEALPADSLLRNEAKLLTLTKSWMARLPVGDIDVLMVDEIGKNISGTGMDAKVINRGAAVDTSPDAQLISTIYVRDLTGESYGSAVGIGMADVMHSRIREKLDINAGLINAMTSGSLMHIRMPVEFGSDRECLEICARTSGVDGLAGARIVWIKNTLELETTTVSEPVARELEKSGAEIDRDALPLAFDRDGNLPRNALS